MRNVNSINPQSTHATCQRHHGAARGWILFLLILVVGGGGGWMAVQKMKAGETVDTRGGTVKARRGDLNITVTQGGSIRAHKSVEYQCQVESRGMSTGITILSVVPAGTYITQEDVDAGKILVELDSSAFEDRLIAEELELNSDKENATAAEESFTIQITQNESAIARAEMDVRFALMDLQKYLGRELADRMVADVNQATDLSAYITPFIEEMKSDPKYLDVSSGAGQEYKRLKDDITLAQGNLSTAEATLIGTQKLFDANYVSKLDLQRDELTRDNRAFAAENAQVTLELFLKYDFPKSAEQQLSNYIESLRSLNVTKAECRSNLAQANVRLSSAKERLKRQEESVQEIIQQIENCTIRAKAPGLVVYGTGGSGDMFRMMRGRGGGGSGIIAEGETVSERQVLISMPDTKNMIAEIGVHETDVDKITTGQPARIVMDAFPDKMFDGWVTEVAPLPDQERNWMNPDLKVYKTLVSIDGSHEFLKSRMSCKVEILVRELQDVVLVPIQVVANRGGRKVCYLVTSSGTEEREVVTGAFSDTLVQIVEGLQEGDEVLLNPPMFAASAEETAFRQRFQPAKDMSGGDDAQDISSDSQEGSRRQGRRQRNADGATEQPQTQEGRSPRQGAIGIPDLSNLSEEQRKAMQEGMERFQNMSDEERQKLMQQGMERFRNMSDEERQKLMQQFQGGGGLGGSGRPGNRPSGNQTNNEQ